MFCPRSFNACLRRAIRWSFRGYRYKAATTPAPAVPLSLSPYWGRLPHPAPRRAEVSRKVDVPLSPISVYPLVSQPISKPRPAAIKRNGGLRGSTASRWSQ